jgi:hypothetical protein
MTPAQRRSPQFASHGDAALADAAGTQQSFDLGSDKAGQEQGPPGGTPKPLAAAKAKGRDTGAQRE